MHRMGLIFLRRKGARAAIFFPYETAGALCVLEVWLVSESGDSEQNFHVDASQASSQTIYKLQPCSPDQIASYKESDNEEEEEKSDSQMVVYFLMQ